MVLFLLNAVNSKVTHIDTFLARKKQGTMSSVGYSALVFCYINVRLGSALGVFTLPLTFFPFAAFRKIAEISVSFSVMSARCMISAIALLACNKSGPYLTYEPHEDDRRIFVCKVFIK